MSSFTDYQPRSLFSPAADAAVAFVKALKGTVSITLDRDFDSASDPWTRLQSECSSTHAQSFSCAKSWHENVSGPAGAEPAIVIGRASSGDLLFVMPFEVVRRGGLRALQWIGQENGPCNAGIYTREFIRSVTLEETKSILISVAEMVGDVSFAYLRSQPYEWSGRPNPFAALPRQASPASGRFLYLDHDFATLYRNRFGGAKRNALRRAEHQLEQYGRVAYRLVQNAPEQIELIDDLLAGSVSGQVAPGYTMQDLNGRKCDYFADLASLPEGIPGRLMSSCLQVGDRVVSSLHGTMIDGRFQLLMRSPETKTKELKNANRILLFRHLQELSHRGCVCFDFGQDAGQESFKWSDENYSLFDSFIALDEAGYTLTVPLSMASKTRNWASRSPLISGLANLFQ